MAYTTSNRVTAPTVAPINKKYSIVIPAAGLGSRMKSYGPKSLTKIKDDITIIDNQLKHIKRYFRGSQVIVVAGFEAEKVKRKFAGTSVQVVENHQYEETNVAASIAIGINEAKHRDVIIIYGDLVFNAYTLKAPFGSYSLVITDGFGNMGNNEVGCVVQDHTVEHMMFDLPEKWAQISYFRGKELKLLEEILLFGDTAKSWQRFGFEIINIIINSGGTFGAVTPQRMRVIDIDSSRDLAKVEQVL